MCKITAFFVINGGKVIFIVGGGVCGGGKRFGGVIFSLSKSKEIHPYITFQVYRKINSEFYFPPFLFVL